MGCESMSRLRVHPNGQLEWLFNQNYRIFHEETKGNIMLVTFKKNNVV